MIEIVFKIKENRSIAYDNDKEIGECVFVENKDIWNIVHTGEDGANQGQGIEKKIVNCIIENAKKENKNLIANCSYAKIVLERNKEK